MEESQKAEKFTLIDPASFPEKPVSPNRPLIIALGIFLGLATGISTLMVSDQLDHSIKDADEIGWLSDLPVLGSISLIITPEYAHWLKKRRLIIAGASFMSVLLVLVLVHFLYMNLWVLMAKLSRWFNRYI
jgi:uncharacterized protein involved in exopolysaccharide biosynthesis